MAELRFEAPLATFDMDEWNEFVEEGGPVPCDVKQADSVTCCSQSSISNSISDDNKEDFENENLSGSLEDLVNTFDAKIIKCFKNFSEQSEAIAPIQSRGEQELLAETQTWWTLTGQYGNIYPIDWTRSCLVSELRNREEESFSQAIVDSGVVDDNQDGIMWSEDSPDFRDELFEDPLVTADQVISELDEFLDSSHEHKNRLHRKNFVSRILSSDHLRLTKKFHHREGKSHDDSALRSMSVEALMKTREEMNRSILEHSEVLIRELDARDELEYEKELKNQFIWLLITIQKRRKELLLQGHNNNNNNVSEGGMGQEVNNNNNNNKSKHSKTPVYLTTVIPFKKQQSPPSIDILLVFIRILTAINENSPATPALLTDYILKILCPAA